MAAAAAVSAALTRRVRGPHYEALCVDVLARAGLLLRRRGGPGDAGVDLLGRFDAAAPWPPGAAGGPAPVEVLAQCKSEAKPLGPVYVREFEGVLAARAAAGAQGGVDAAGRGLPPAFASSAAPPPLGLLISASPFTPAALRQATGSRWPLALLHLEGAAGAVLAAVPSRSASANGCFDGVLRALAGAVDAPASAGGAIEVESGTGRGDRVPACPSPASARPSARQQEGPRIRLAPSPRRALPDTNPPPSSPPGAARA